MISQYSVKVAAKIAKVMGMIEYLKKDGRVEFGGTKYNYLSEAKITQQIREKTLEVGLVIVPVSCKVMELPNQSEAVEMGYAIIDTESGEAINVNVAGKGQDKGDKSMYKAMTGAYKYMQRQTFAIPTGDDPDKISSDEVEEEIRKMQEEQNKQFEQAVKEMEESKGQEAPPPPKKDNKKLEPFQAVYALATKKGMTQAQVKAWAKKAFDLKVDEDKVSLKTMSKEQLDKITAALNKYPDKKGDK
jgi:outer membrane protein OmpA-like peptidoglycan-associated protein